MSQLKNTDGNKYRGRLSVYACQSDTTHPVVLDLAKKSGMITEERVKEILDVQKGTKSILDNSELSVILESFFGFEGGMFESHEIEGVQKTRTGKSLAGEVRYTGEERTDKAWCSTALASPEAKEKSVYGSIVTMEEHQGYGELSIIDSESSDY
jgi:hypothetical protein